MTVIHIVCFKFRPETSETVKETFVTELRKLKFLPCVQDQKLVVGGPSITTPISRSHGYHFCLLSFHQDRKALEEYQSSAEHHHVTSTYMWPFNDDLMRFDFEIGSGEGEHEMNSALLGTIILPFERESVAIRHGLKDMDV